MGIVSLVWAGGGLLILKLTNFHSDDPTLKVLTVLGAWWGVAILLALSGFSSRYRLSILISLSTVVLFIYFLWTSTPTYMSAPRYYSPSHGAPMTAAATQIAAFQTALDSFRVDIGSYPTGTNALQNLVRQPAGITNWHGPYLDSIPKDPWNHNYIYECPGRHNSNSFDISSPGPPQMNSPVANWMQPSVKH
jgi:general secretion pathway protein G